MDGKERASEPFVWVEECSNFEWHQQQQQEQQYQHPNPSTRKRKKMEFVGWGSRPLIQFLESIGRDTSHPISQFDVTAIVTEYVDRHLLHPATLNYSQYSHNALKNKAKKKRKKRVLCDERLRLLFGRKSISRVMIYKLLERHLAEANQLLDSDDSHDYLSGDNDEEEEEDKGKHKKTYHPGELFAEMSTSNPIPIPKSCFAAVIPENIKLVYLRRSLIQEILKQQDDTFTLEMKIVGTFVRTKSDPNDFLQKHSYQILQVTGLKRDSMNDDNDTKIRLCASDMINEIPISTLSDDDFSEEECDYLRQKMKDGMFKRLTVEELQLKAEILHEDMTKHWLARELALLQNLIDRANEKGWRKEMFEYLERKELLLTQDEQSRLLSELPKIIEEEIEPEATPRSSSDEVEQRNDSPPISTLKSAMEAPYSDISDDEFELTWALDGYSSEEPQPVEPAQECDNGLEKSKKESHGVSETQNASEVADKLHRGVIEKEVIDLSDDEENEEQSCKVHNFVDMLGEPQWHYSDPQGDTQGPFAIACLKRWSDADYFPPDFRIWKTGQSRNEAVYLKDILGQDFPN